MADAAQVFSSSDISVVDYRCTLGPADQPFPEVHRSFSLAYVRKGSFGCRTGGRTFELVAGSILVGHPGNEYTCRQASTDGLTEASAAAHDAVGHGGGRNVEPIAYSANIGAANADRNTNVIRSLHRR